MLGSLDGHVVLRERRVGTDPVALGRLTARALLDGGGEALLGA